MRLDLGDAHARQGEIDDALTDFRLARRIYPNLRIPADTWYTLCWNAVLNGRAAAVVGEACHNAVALKPDDVDKIDARGLAYALTGHRTEAIADFTVYVRNDRVREPEKALRRLWIQRLRAGTKDPVPRSELDELGKEEDSSASD